MTKTALILGASGNFGRNCAVAFETAGWQVRRFNRATDDMNTAAMGAEIIVNGLNPPKYHDWPGIIPQITQQVIEAARASGATVILPGNVYVFGEDAPERFAADTPHGARNTLGQVRVQMEAAYRSSGVQTIILRMGDFIDTQPMDGWFDSIMTKKSSGGVFSYPGPTDRAHAWAYLPDAARAVVALAGMRTRLETFEDVPFPGFTLTGADMARAVGQALHQPQRIKKMAWWPLRLAAPFWELGRRLVEMSYLWRKPHFLDGARFARLLPDFFPTPLDQALGRALQVQIHPDKAVA